MYSDPCNHISALLNKMSSVTLIDNSFGLLFNNGMQTIEEIRLARLVMLKNKFGGVSALAEILEMSASQLSQWLNSSEDSKTGKPRTMNSESARRAEEKLDLPRTRPKIPENAIEIASYAVVFLEAQCRNNELDDDGGQHKH